MQVSQQLKSRYPIKCQKQNESFLACYSQDCYKHPFICDQKNCQCRQDHIECFMLATNQLEKAIRKKILSLSYFQEKIQIFFQQIIDKLSIYRDQLLSKLKTTHFGFLGLSEKEKQIIKAFDSQNYQRLNGQKFWYAQSQIKQKSQKAQKVKLNFSQIQKTLKQFTLDTQKLNQNLKHRIQNLQKGLIWGSKIIKSPQSSQIIESFFENKRIKSVKLLYRASQYNFSSQEFYNKCENVKDTLTICHTEFDKIIGGYTPLAWINNKQVQSDPSLGTFLFSLTNKHKFKQKNAENAIYGDSRYGPYFSNNNNLAIVNQSNKQNCVSNINYNFTNQNYIQNDINSYKLFTGSSNQNFKLKQWQVFHLQFEK